MSDQLPFKSRREMREAERAGLIEPQELPFDATPRVGDAKPVPVESTGEPLTRRQLRELEKTGGILAVHTSQVELPSLPPEPQSWAPEPEAQSQDAIAADQGFGSNQGLGATQAYEPVLAEREEPMTAANPIWASEPEVQDAPAPNAAATEAAPSPAPVEQPMAPVPAPEETAADREAVLNAAREFDALFDRIGEEQKPARSVKRILAANSLGILK
jgi:hypothetical protein